MPNNKRAYRSLEGQAPLTLGWLLGERPSRGQGHWKFYSSNFPEDAALQDLVEIDYRRWTIERFHQDSKYLLEWDNYYQGRLWKGFHRHAILVMLSYSFLVWQEWHHWHSTPRARGCPHSTFSPQLDKGRKSLTSAHILESPPPAPEYGYGAGGCTKSEHYRRGKVAL